ncbi:DUF4924 family protein [Paludibacter sp. 221]|uniref:DUF4924 family protein n=1 Tax=Paludibacter sp. 221 TaxID=2302939 RepID=UPI0013D0D015|nr:DUF4924 family protein [Paludibacter sp. 221]NDV45764.1 DUF4924 family protein [Paludibacter sp. 221]
MFIAQKLRKENIVEYLLYMWQVEDIIRACGLSIEVVNEKVISPQQLEKEDKALLYNWYQDLIEMMKLEGVEKSGHIQINKNIIIELGDLHQSILASGKDVAYTAKFYHILPFITQLRKQQIQTDISDIEICFNFLYGILMLRMKKAEISPETRQAQDEITKFMVLLSKDYNLYKSGELEID